MSVMGPAKCPISGAASSTGSCPASRSASRMGPRGCAFSGFSQSSAQALYGAPQGPDAPQILQARETKTLVHLLLPTAPPKEKTAALTLKTVDSLTPSPDSVLAAALGSPARRVLQRAETVGPTTGWRDGYLSSTHGFCPPDPSASPIALAMSPGRVWSDLCNRMPGLVGRGKIREAILQLPMVSGGPETIPDSALWAATVCLGILASVYRYEERNDGTEGIVVGSGNVDRNMFLNAAGDAEDEELETKGIPRNIAIPLRAVCTRMGRPLPHLTQYDVSIYNFKLRDQTSVYPYPQRAENMDLRWPVFNDRAEAMFLLCMAEVHGAFTSGVELVVRCQEAIMEKDNEALLEHLVALKMIVDQLGPIFHKISVNPSSGELFANPVEWGQRYAKFSAPLSNRVPALSGLALPLFQLLDAFMGRQKYDTFLGLEALHLRAWLPLNHRAFITAVEKFYPMPEYVKSTNDSRLHGVLEGLVESYMGERGFMGTHRYKVYGFLEVVAKTGRTETNGGAGSADSEGRPWEEVHKTLSDSMIERLEPYRKNITLKPHEMRGCFEECRFRGKVTAREWIDTDEDRNTAKVSIGINDSGVTFGPGDRLTIMPLNSLSEAGKVADALGLVERLDEALRLGNGSASDWKRFRTHLSGIEGRDVQITVRDVLRRGKLQPMTKEMVMKVHILLRGSSSTLLKLLSSEEWPVVASLGDILGVAKKEVDEVVWEAAFGNQDLDWLSKLIPVEVPRTYSISSFEKGLLPDVIELTVSRAEHRLSPLLTGGKEVIRAGISSGFLNPRPSFEQAEYGADEDVLIGISRPLNFALPISPAAPVVMFAGGSGIAPFRSFWRARISGGAIGRNILFLGIQSRKKFSYEDELRDAVAYDGLELHTAFSRDRKALIYDPSTRTLVEADREPRYLDTTILEQGSMVTDLVMSTKQGGLGGYLYICGSVSVYETVIAGITRAIYKHRTGSKSAADDIIATAFAERRFMLDIFMTPQAMSFKQPVISVSQLARHTGHRDGSKTWIGVHGSVYDITDFLPIHPGGSLIVQASAGLDASKTFDDLAHTSNPEVMSLLSKYFIGHLAPKPAFSAPELGSLYDGWYDYLRTCVESITTLSFEVKSICKDTHIWFSGGLLNMGGVRKFYQFQSRLIQNGFSTLFGSKLQELFVKLTFTLVDTRGRSEGVLPDVMGRISRAGSSVAAGKAKKEIAAVGELVCASTTAQTFEKGLMGYARGICEADVRFLEGVREEICHGMDAFELIQSMKSSTLEKQRLFKLAGFLMSILERIAVRLEGFYNEIGEMSMYHPEMESNPARARWAVVRRRVRDGSFFVLARDVELDGQHSESLDFDQQLEMLSQPYEIQQRHQRATKRQSISFESIMAQATRDFQPREQRIEDFPSPPKRLAEAHAARANINNTQQSSYDQLQDSKAANRISQFMQSNLKAIRRLSRITTDQINSFTPQHAIAAPIYGAPSGSIKQIQYSSPAFRQRAESSPSKPPTQPLPPLPTHEKSQSISHQPGLWPGVQHKKKASLPKIPTYHTSPVAASQASSATSTASPSPLRYDSLSRNPSSASSDSSQGGERRVPRGGGRDRSLARMTMTSQASDTVSEMRFTNHINMLPQERYAAGPSRESSVDRGRMGRVRQEDGEGGLSRKGSLRGLDRAMEALRGAR
ncbi:hypothetical protein BJ508DRAFT_332183 [Ascobolus immersus RN42]|uniref:NADPH--hemoprotein reductase n=1 Tax=Ascobolus immersus RN42 TaxID=1160509 RepID=A0A3N4HNH2_ASCIM|nr:hypothetical protein BJ508DRAFT_332183 [Ascobolus immersus RN42]